jgi:hypothetical protein
LRQQTIEAFHLAIAADQLVFHKLTCCGIKNRYLLPTGMKMINRGQTGRSLFVF